MTVYDFFIDFAIASVLILVGQLIRAKVKLFQEFFIPASMIAGFLGLFLGKQFLNILPYSDSIGSYAGVLIIIVFAVVGLNGFTSGGKESSGAVVKRVASFTMYRFVIFFIQFVFGIAATLTIVKWAVPGINPGFGILMASGFTGGHGTAAAVGKTFADLGYAEAGDLGMTFATIGILSGIFGGLAFIKVATKKGWTAYIKDFKFISGDLRTGLVAKGNRGSMGQETISSVSLDSLAFHVCLVLGLAGGGYFLNSRVLAVHVLKGIPDFTVAFILSLIFFLLFHKTKIYDYIDKNVNSRVSGTATDYLVFFGIASIKIAVVIEYAVPLVILTLVGFVCVFLTMIPLGYRMNRDSWFERSIFCYGYSTGVFAIGFVLLRIVDPENKSCTVEDTAMSPWLSFLEIAFWSAIPAALLAGQGWYVVGIVGLATVACLAVSVVGKMWYLDPPDAREAVGMETVGKE